MQIGADPNQFLAEAYVVLVLNSLAPWMPDAVTLGPDLKVIQLGPDPLFSRTPVRNFQANVTLAGETGPTLLALIQAMKGLARNEDVIQERRRNITALSAATSEVAIARAQSGNSNPMTKEWVSLCLGRAIKPYKASVFHELGCPLIPLDLQDHLSYFQEPHSGGLGWGFPAAMGAQLADPDRLIFATWATGVTCFPTPRPAIRSQRH